MKIAYLEKCIPGENQYRYYSIYIARTLFGHWALVREWGRIGSKGGQRQEEWYEKETEALAAGLQYMKVKKKRGYAASRPKH